MEEVTNIVATINEADIPSQDAGLKFSLKVKKLIFKNEEITEQEWSGEDHLTLIELHHNLNGMEEDIQVHFPNHDPNFISFIIKMHEFSKTHVPKVVPVPLPAIPVPKPLTGRGRGRGRGWTMEEDVELFFLTKHYDLSSHKAQGLKKWDFIANMKAGHRSSMACEKRYPKLDQGYCMGRDDKEEMYKAAMENALRQTLVEAANKVVRDAVARR